jgi:hypothetical protein
MEQQEPAHIMSDSIISEMEFSGFPRKRESISWRSPSGGGHKSRNKTQPIAVVSGAALSRTAGTRRGTGFFSWQWQHVGSLPAAAGHRLELQKYFISCKTLRLPLIRILLFRSLMKPRK